MRTISAAAMLAFLPVSWACTAKQATLPAALESRHSVTLNWQPTPGTKYYYVYRSAVSQSRYQKIGTTPTPSYKDAPVPGGAIYYYVVTAVNDRGESKFSSEIKAVVPGK